MKWNVYRFGIFDRTNLFSSSFRANVTENSVIVKLKSWFRRYRRQKRFKTPQDVKRIRVLIKGNGRSTVGEIEGDSKILKTIVLEILSLISRKVATGPSPHKCTCQFEVSSKSKTISRHRENKT